MIRATLLAAWCAWQLAVPAAAPATTPPQPEIVLPPLLVAGKWATLAVVAGDGRLLSGATVELSDGRKVRTDETGRAVFLAPAGPGLLTATLAPIESGLAGTPSVASLEGIGASAPVVADLLDPLTPFHIDRVPLTFARKELVPLVGFGFGGRADQNRAWLGNEPALVLAASPLAIVFAPAPSTPPGPLPLILQSGDHRVEAGRATVVELSLSAYADTLKTGQKNYVYVMVRGTEDSVALVVRNLNPEAVQWMGGEELFIRSTGGPTNSGVVEVAGKASGEFRLAAWVIPPPSATPLASRLRELLLAARGHADSDLVRRLSRLLLQLDKQPQQPEKIRGDLVKLARRASAARIGHPEIRLYLDAAIQILPGR